MVYEKFELSLLVVDNGLKLYILGKSYEILDLLYWWEVDVPITFQISRNINILTEILNTNKTSYFEATK